PEMTVNRDWTPCFAALLHWSADRFGLQSLRDPTEIVAEGEEDEPRRKDRHPGKHHGEHLRQRLPSRHQRPEHEHHRHQNIDAAEHQVVGHDKTISSRSWAGAAPSGSSATNVR